jgi:hypothetical protein
MNFRLRQQSNKRSPLNEIRNGLIGEVFPPSQLLEHNVVIGIDTNIRGNIHCFLYDLLSG